MGTKAKVDDSGILKKSSGRILKPSDLGILQSEGKRFIRAIQKMQSTMEQFFCAGLGSGAIFLHWFDHSGASSNSSGAFLGSQ